MSYAIAYNGPMAEPKKTKRLVVTGEMQRISVTAPDAVYERIREQAFREKKTMNLVVVEILAAHYGEAVTSPAPEDGSS